MFTIICEECGHKTIVDTKGLETLEFAGNIQIDFSHCGDIRVVCNECGHKIEG